MAPVDRDDVAYGYRYILGREPEASMDYGVAAQVHSDWRALRTSLLNSYEASASVYATVFAGKTQWVKVPTWFGRQAYICLADIAVSRDILLTGHWEWETENLLRSLLTPDAFFLDLGANIGWFSLLAGDLMARAEGKGRVIAVEANPSLLPYLMASIVESGLAERVAVKPYAVSSQVGLVQMDAEVSGNVGGLGIVPLSEALPRRNVVPTIPLDQLLGDLDRLDLVKMDIEGAEPFAIRGFTQLLKRFRPIILMEFNEAALKSVSGLSIREFLNELAGLGYRPHEFHGGERRPLSVDEVVAIVTEKTYYDFLFLPS